MNFDSYKVLESFLRRKKSFLQNWARFARNIETDSLLYIFLILQIPQDPEAMRQWMYNLYAEKEKMLEESYKPGIFPYNMFPPATTSTATSPAASEREPRPLYHDPIKFVLLHLFFGVSTSLMYFSCRQLLWWRIALL